MGGLKFTKPPGNRQTTRGSGMTVTLKQRTWRTADGKAVPDGHPLAAILIGPPGAKVTDEQARELGLKDGALPKGAEAGPREPTSREALSQQVRDAEAARDGKKGADDSEPGDDRTAKIKEAMRDMAAEVKADPAKEDELFTAAGKPDANVLSSRAGHSVKATERNDLWAEVVIEDEVKNQE